MITKFDPEQEVWIIKHDGICKVIVDRIIIRANIPTLYEFIGTIECRYEKSVFKTKELAELELARRGK